MSNVLKFPNSDHLKPFPVAIDHVLRAAGIPKKERENAVQWAEETDRCYRIPLIEISIEMPDGLTAEQVEHIRREIHREFARYGDSLRLAKHTYMIDTLKKRMGFIVA